MIECLSDSSWIDPQIDFLLTLQNLRINHFSMLDDLFLSVTIIGEFWLPTLICALVYWCIDVKAGLYLTALSGYNVLFTQLFKMCACVYRPWILSDKIQPVKKALALAIGYSFPSGHSAQASSLLGGIAFLARKKIILSILLLVLAVFLVGFSRLWLGVHTPQDVIVGLITGFTLVFILNFVINWVENNKNRYLYLIAITNIVIIAILIYLCYFNSYPLDYVNGELLVNPHSSIKSTIWCYGYIGGILNGAFLCRRFFPFDLSSESIKARLIKAIIGGTGLILLLRYSMVFLTGAGYRFKTAFIVPFLCGLIITAIYPYIFSKINNYFKSY